MKAIFQSLFYFAVYLALMLLGWGIDDLGGFFANPGRLGAALILLAQAGFRLARSFLPNRVPDRRLEHIGVYRLQLMAMETVFVIAPFCDRRGLTVLAEPARGWGLALLALGTLLSAWAVLTWPPRLVLVDNLNELSPEHALATYPGAGERLQADGADFRSGPFRWLRYPYFAGQVLIILGVGLAFRAWAGVLLAGLMLLVVAVRTRQMDDIYLRQFGPAWGSYMEGTKRLVPGVY